MTCMNIKCVIYYTFIINWDAAYMEIVKVAFLRYTWLY